MADSPVKPIIDHLFRHESGKLVSVLTGVFGPQYMDLAEDVVQDTLVEALEHWEYDGVPDNPSGWLFRVAKNKALNILHREKYKRTYGKEVLWTHSQEGTEAPPDPFSQQGIEDDQLRMIFTCCHPAISADSQIALALKTLCGFSIPEIAKAFLTSEENINKRLVRARQTIRDARVPFEIPAENELDQRLSTVLETIYLLFNEGYSASRGDFLVRYELCEEAVRLAQIVLANNSFHRKENVHALLALMLLNASRFEARQDEEGNLVTMAWQDRSLWDERLQNMGLQELEQASRNGAVSVYHILAAISAQYIVAADYESTDWRNILSLYDALLHLDGSPLVLLNRAVVISKVHGVTDALREMENIQQDPLMKNYYLFYSTQAELFADAHEIESALASLERAIQLAPLLPEKELLRKKMAALRERELQ